MTFIDRISGVLDRRVSRRSFVVRSAFVGSALATGGLDFVLHPGSAYSQLCASAFCGSPNCDCSSTCCAGYTEFCCVLTGFNSCPAGTVMGGWWLAEGSAYCSGPRYYMDCNAACNCTSGCAAGQPFCHTDCDGVSCHCGLNSCAHFFTGCLQFRYGQCNQDNHCLGRILCRVVTCVPPWEIEPNCTTVSATDNRTANQNAGCLTPGPTESTLEPTMFIAYATTDSTDGTIKRDEQFVVREAGIVSVISVSDSNRLQTRLGPLVPLSGNLLVGLRTEPT
jgi:hypothetical protein